MSVPSTAEKALLRTQSQVHRLHLSIYKPGIQFQAQVNDATIGVGSQVITYDNVVTGSYSAIRFGATLLVGSTPGASDKGSIYIYRSNATTLTVGENNHINWEDDDYLTAINFHQIFPIYPSYSLDGDNFTVLKAYDTAYTDQNEVLGAFVCMGSHYAGFMEPNGTHQIWYTATGTNHVKDSPITYFWEFEGGSPPTATTAVPGWVQYSSPGHYSSVLTVKDGSGTNVGRGIRHISLYDRPGGTGIQPIKNWGLDSLSGDRAEGGYRARIWVRENIDDIQDGALVVLFSENWYGNTKQSIGGNAENRQSIFFTGYILGDTIDFNYETSTVSFDVGSPTEVMKLAEAFSVSVEDSADPIGQAAQEESDPWFYLDGLTLKTSLFHYLRWHSNVNNCTDIQFLFTDRSLRFFEPDRTSLFDACQAFLESTSFARIVCDRQGKIFFSLDGESINAAASSVTKNMDLQSQDWVGTPNIRENVIAQFSYIQLGGTAYTRGVGDIAYLSAAPGEVPGYRGRKFIQEGLVLIDQDTLDVLSGNILAWRNARFPEVNVELAGNYANFDIVPLERVEMYLTPDQTFRKLDWNGKPFSVEAVSWKYNAELGLLTPTISLHEITQGFSGMAIPIPEVPPTDGQDQPQTTLYIPPIIDIPSFDFPTVGGGVAAQFAYPNAYVNDLGVFGDTDMLYWEAVLDSGSTIPTEVYGNIFLPPATGTWEIYPIIRNNVSLTNNIDMYHDGNALEIGGVNATAANVPFSTVAVPSRTVVQLYSVASHVLTFTATPSYYLNVELLFESENQDYDAYLYGWIAILV